MSPDTRTRDDTGPIRYLALGDSFTIGTGIAPERAFPGVLVTRWRAAGREVWLTNPSVNGYTTEDVITRELPLAASGRPTLVTLLIGANDIVRGSDDARYRQQLRRIHDGLRDAGVPATAVVVLPQPEWSRSPAAAPYGTPEALQRRILSFNKVTMEEAERVGSRYVDLFPLMRRQAAAEMLAPDGLHPSAEAHAELALELAKSI